MAKSLHQMTSQELGKLFPIYLTEHDPKWKFLFSDEKNRLTEKLGDEFLVRVDHIGSTAIPGILSKPTIDILLQVAENTPNQTIKDCFEKLGYIFIAKPENPPPHMLFVKGYTPEGFKGQAYHVHVRYPGDWDEIRFRDYLCQHPAEAKAYARLKIVLSEKYKYDRDGYTDAKVQFVKAINREAKELKDK